MKTPEQRGPFGAWMRAERERRDWTVERLADELGKVRQPFSVTYLRGLEAGRRPSNRAMAALAKVYDSQPPADQTEPSDLQEVGAAIREQTAAIRQQTAKLDELISLLRDRADQAVTEGVEEGLRRFLEEIRGHGADEAPGT